MEGDGSKGLKKKVMPWSFKERKCNGCIYKKKIFFFLMDSDLKGNILYKCKQDMEGRKRTSL